jgi:predicted nucleic acid-binding protein
MLIADSGVWTDYYEGRDNPHTVWLDRHIRIKRVGLTDRILCEVLQGVRLDSVFAERLKELSNFEIFNTGGDDLAILSAQNYRHLRSAGITVRTAVDCLIATFCILHGHTLLHRDRDFDPFEQHLGLSVLHPSLQ